MSLQPKQLPFESEQSELTQALLDTNVACPDYVVQRSRDGFSRRFNIYRNNRATSLIENLQATYPALLKLVGNSYFNAVARQFIDIHPPQSPVLFEYGAAFGEYLCSMPSAQKILYVADVAKIEWLRHKAYHAIDAYSLKLKDVADVSPDKLANAVLIVHPSVGFVSSKWAAGSIWTATVAGNTGHHSVSTNVGEHILVLRREYNVVQYMISGYELKFLSLIAEGLNLTQAASRVIENTSDFNTGVTLTKFIELNLFCSIRYDAYQAE